MAVRKLRAELSATIKGEHPDTLRLLLATILLATTEVSIQIFPLERKCKTNQLKGVNGNTQGAAHCHLRASQTIVSTTLASTANSADQELRSFLIESYAYLTLVANITFGDDRVSYDLLMDPLLSSLEQHRPKGTYGTMMGCAHGLFELIPSICRLAHARMGGNLHGMASAESLAQYSWLEQRIRTWTVPGNLLGGGEWFDQLSTAAYIYKYALLVFLHTAFHCSPIADDQVISRLQPEIDAIIPLALQLLPYDDPSPLANILLWPAIIVGSCLRHGEQQRLLQTTLTGHPFNLAITDRAARLLGLLWNEHAEPAKPLFGPMGLQIIMEKYKINLSMA